MLLYLLPLTELKDYIAYPLYLLFRRSLDIGVVLEDWKCANITSIFKKGHRNKAENYRPVSLTSQVCKIFETIVKNSVVKYLETNLLILDFQHTGFVKVVHVCLIFLCSCIRPLEATTRDKL